MPRPLDARMRSSKPPSPTMQTLVPDDVMALLRERVTSLEQLETLMRLRNEPTRTWTLVEVAERLQVPMDAVDDALHALSERGLLERDHDGSVARWRYRPSSVELEAGVTRLAEAYRARTLEIMRILSSQALERIRDSAARAFADAFIIGRKKDG